MNKKLKKTVSAALVSAMMLTTAVPSLCMASLADNTAISAPASRSYKITSKKVTYYSLNIDQKEEETLYFVNGTDIPYIEMNDLV